MNGVAERRTARLHLTRIRPADYAALHAMHRDRRVMATLGGVRSASTTQQVLDLLIDHWNAHGFGYWMARELASGRFAGRGGLRRVEIAGRPAVEVGYAFMPEFWGQGLATELATESVRVGFEALALDELVAFTLPTNRASQRVMEKVGFRFVGDIVWAERPHVLYGLKRA